MSERPERLPQRQEAEPERPAKTLATEALRTLARARGGESSANFMETLRAAVLDPDPRALRALIDEMLDAGIPKDRIVDRYIPSIARLLGQEWCEDTTSFAEVTIGSARLQSAVREIDPALHGGDDDGGEGAMVIVLSDEHHTLGAVILCSQLRRLGLSVRLLLGADPDRATRALRTGGFDAVLISASHTQTLEYLALFVETLKERFGQELPVAIGGPILENENDAIIKSRTGADVVTSDVEEAIRACRLKTSRSVMNTGMET